MFTSFIVASLVVKRSPMKFFNLLFIMKEEVLLMSENGLSGICFTLVGCYYLV